MALFFDFSNCILSHKVDIVIIIAAKVDINNPNIFFHVKVKVFNTE